MVEFTIIQFYSEKSQFYENWDVPVYEALKFINKPISVWVKRQLKSKRKIKWSPRLRILWIQMNDVVSVFGEVGYLILGLYWLYSGYDLNGSIIAAFLLMTLMVSIYRVVAFHEKKSIINEVVFPSEKTSN
ncbi:MAG: hypothetical protein ACE5I5_05095 [Candidatus Heimdallarchaeota archaeon]